MIGLRDKVLCPDCGKKMYKLRDNTISTYVCPKCGCSIDEENQSLKSDEMYHDPDQLSDDNKEKKLIENLFNSNFMKKYTKYDNFSDFIQDSDLIPKNSKVISYELFKKISRDKLDKYIKASTNFDSWDDMFDRATSRYLRI